MPLDHKGKGLKMLRMNQNDKVPKHECSNCKCKRYSPCTCMKSNGMTRKERRQLRMEEYKLSQKVA
jgi:hypothetical protein